MRHFFSFLLLLCGISVHSYAAPVVFNIDSTQSGITLSGKLAGFPLTEQGPGSLASRFTGTIKADVTGTTIQFPGGSAIDALTNGFWHPQTNGVKGTAVPADFAGTITVPIFGTGYGAFRDILLDVVSGVLPLTGGTFNAAALTFGFLTNNNARADYNSSVRSGSLALTGYATNKITTVATLTNLAGVRQLTIKIDAEYFYTVLSPNDTSARIAGQILAVEAGGLTIGSISFLGGKIIIEVIDTSPTVQIQSSTDLITWLPRAVDSKVVAGGKTTFTITPSGPEFFRVFK